MHSCKQTRQVHLKQHLIKWTQLTPLNQITAYRISRLVESNILAGTESFPVAAVLKCAVYRISRLTECPEVILSSGVYYIQIRFIFFIQLGVRVASMPRTEIVAELWISEPDEGVQLDELCLHSCLIHVKVAVLKHI